MALMLKMDADEQRRVAVEQEAEVARLTKLAKRAEDFDAGWLAAERGEPVPAEASPEWVDGWDYHLALDALHRLRVDVTAIAQHIAALLESIRSRVEAGR